jgi:5,5'-dehydrodivanillate O-demethylase
VLSAETNERLTRVGPGTPCGELMRRYWLPIAALAQLDENPVRKVRILGEDLVLFRDRSGGLGLIGQRCLHRLVDLKYGIPDENGLRCPYHGWLYDASGACIERPMELHPCAPIKQRLQAYPVREMGGMVFAYMGPLPAPHLPPWDLFVWPNAVRQIAINVLPCNWLQCQENTGDPTHSVYTHGVQFQYALDRKGEGGRSENEAHAIPKRLAQGLGIEKLYAEATPYGFTKGVSYAQALGAKSDHVAPHGVQIFPFYTQPGSSSPGAPRAEYQIRVPIDDTHTLHFCYQVYAAPPGIEAPRQDTVPYYQPPTHDEKGEPILDYVLAQDAIVWTAQGEIADRSKETLGRTDLPIVLLRKQLEEQITRVEQGKDPMNVFRDDPGPILHGSGQASKDWTAPDWASRKLSLGLDQNFRKSYHKGFAIDDVDRYGPAVGLVQELHRRIDQATRLAAPAK